MIEKRSIHCTEWYRRTHRYTCTHTYVHIHTHVCPHMYIHIFSYVCMYTKLKRGAFVPRNDTDVRTDIHAHTHMYIYTHVYVHICICIYFHICVYVYMIEKRSIRSTKWDRRKGRAVSIRRNDQTVSTEHDGPSTSTKSRNPNSSVQIQIQPKSQFEFEPKLYREIPRNVRFLIWWIMGVLHFQWKLLHCYRGVFMRQNDDIH